jgi:hypothetical protein
MNSAAMAFPPKQFYPCGHTDTPVKYIGNPPYPVPIPSKGERLCPACFLADCHLTHFLEHEQRLNLGPLEADIPYDSWYSMLLRQREVLRYEHELQLRIDLSEAAKQRVWKTFLESVRSISAHYDAQRWQTFSASHEPVYQETERAFTNTLLSELLSGWPVPACDGVVTLKVVDVTHIETSWAERVPLRTLDEWYEASAHGPLVLVCHRAALRRHGIAYSRELLPELVGYLVEDPVTLHLLWQATYYEFRQDGIVDGKRVWVCLERPFYRVGQPCILSVQRFLVKPSCSRFGLFWNFHLAYMPVTEPLQWIDELWEKGGIAEWLQFAAEIRIDGKGDRSERHASGEDQRLSCLYCTQPIDPTSVGGEGDPEFCCEGCFVASRRVPFTEVYAQRVRRTQGWPFACLGPVTVLCTCQHHDPTQCTMQRYHLSQAEMRKQFLPCRCACHITEERKPVGEKDWQDTRQAWEEQWRAWHLHYQEKQPSG